MKKEQTTKTNPHKKYIPLSWAMILIVVFAWFAPMFAISGISLANSLNNTYQRVAEVVETSAVNSMHSVRLNLDFILSDSIKASYMPTIRNAYTKHAENPNQSSFYTKIVTYLKEEYSRNQLVPSVHMVFPKIENPGKVNYFTHNPLLASYADATSFYQNGAYEQCVDLLDTLDSKIDFIQAGGRVYLVRVLSLHKNTFAPYAIMASEINTSLLFEGLLEQEALENVVVYINDIRLPLLGEGPILDKNLYLGSEISRSDENGIISVEGSVVAERYTMFFHVAADMQPMLGSINQNLNILIIVFLFCLPLALVILVFFYYKVSRPINKLSGFSKEIEEGGFGKQIDASHLGSNEFNFLGGQMNGMSAKLQYQFERLYREELHLRDARMKALQSQINPHFLGNTLEIINWESRLAGNTKVSRMLESLSTMMEAVLDRELRPIVHLSEEMVYVQAFLYIASERYGKRLKININIEEDLLEWYVPKLILQPIVENAFEHGIDEQQEGTISINIYKIDKNWMKIDVINNSPMSQEDEKKVSQLLSDDEAMPVSRDNNAEINIGIRNVNQRLILLYGEKARLTIQNDENLCTLSSFCISKEVKKD